MACPVPKVPIWIQSFFTKARGGGLTFVRLLPPSNALLGHYRLVSRWAGPGARRETESALLRRSVFRLRGAEVGKAESEVDRWPEHRSAYGRSPP